MHNTAYVWGWERQEFPRWLRFSPETNRRCDLLPSKHVGIVFQRHKINNYSASRPSRDRGRSLCARLLWEFSNSRVIFEVSHACCCGVCPFRSLSLSLCWCYPPPPPFLRLPHPPPFSQSPSSLHLQSASVVSADCWAVGEKGYREYWSFGESLWKMAPVVTGWVWDSGLAVGSGVERNTSYIHKIAQF